MENLRGPIKLKYSNRQLLNIEFEFELTISALKEIISKNKSSIEDMWTKLENEIENDETLNNLKEEDYGSYRSQFYMVDAYLIEEIKSTNRTSTLITLFTLFEGTLKRIKAESDKIFQNQNSQKISSDIIRRLWKYFTNDVGIEMTNSLSELFKQIEAHIIIRNKLVHHSGIVEDFKEDIFKKMEGLKYMKQSPDPENSETLIIIEDDVFLFNLIEYMVNFVQKLLLQLDKKTTTKK